MKPLIGISMGDPAGVGPEIVAHAMVAPEALEACRMVLVGEKSVMEKAIRITGVAATLYVISDPAQGRYEPGVINLIDLANIDVDAFAFGKVNAQCGKAAYDYIEKVVLLAMDHKVDAIATTPINKESFRAAKVPFIGHTEVLESLTGVHDPLTMFEVRGLRVFFLTRHVSLREACELITYDRIYDYIARCTAALRCLGVEGTLAVAGLNPHSGEHGLFGREEVEAIAPAVEARQQEGYDVAGPIGADSVFHQALQGRYAAVLSLYHDQGHIATKTYDFERTISFTHSMPFLRTSVDHGTAFDIAGKNVASPVSMIEAILLAAKYAPHYRAS